MWVLRVIPLRYQSWGALRPPMPPISVPNDRLFDALILLSVESSRSTDAKDIVQTATLVSN